MQHGRQAAEPAAGEAPRLLERARDGDANAFATLVRGFDPMLRGLAFQLLGERELMDNALQEAYLRAFRALPSFEGRAKVSTWLYRIAYNACLDELRRRKRRGRLPLADAGLEQETVAPDPNPDPGERVAERSALRAALAELSPEERAAVWLVDAQGYDYGATARILDVPEGTVASRLARARTRLRESLEAGR